MDFESRVLPELKRVLSFIKPKNLYEALQMIRSFPLPEREKSEHIRIVTRMIPGSEQGLSVKIYEPIKRSEVKLPAVLWIHGGGYVMGHPDKDDGLCERFVREAECVVVSVDYRLAPEHPYPAAIEDCYAALQWMVKAKDQLNIDPTCFGVAGASSGGGLAAALALMTRDKGGPKLGFQLLIYPMVDDRNMTPSSKEITAPMAPWNRSHSLAAWDMYLGEHVLEEVSPYAAPARAKNLIGLPPAYACVGELDPLRDETIEYVTRMAQAGVPVEFHLYPGCFHGFEIMVPHSEVGQHASQEYIDALAKGLIGE